MPRSPCSRLIVRRNLPACRSLVHGIAMLRITFLEAAQLDFAVADREALLAFNRGLEAG